MVGIGKVVSGIKSDDCSPLPALVLHWVLLSLWCEVGGLPPRDSSAQASVELLGMSMSTRTVTLNFPKTGKESSHFPCSQAL